MEREEDGEGRWGGGGCDSWMNRPHNNSEAIKVAMLPATWAWATAWPSQCPSRVTWTLVKAGTTSRRFEIRARFHYVAPALNHVTGCSIRPICRCFSLKLVHLSDQTFNRLQRFRGHPPRSCTNESLHCLILVPRSSCVIETIWLQHAGINYTHPTVWITLASGPSTASSADSPANPVPTSAHPLKAPVMVTYSSYNNDSKSIDQSSQRENNVLTFILTIFHGLTNGAAFFDQHQQIKARGARISVGVVDWCYQLQLASPDLPVDYFPALDLYLYIYIYFNAFQWVSRSQHFWWADAVLSEPFRQRQQRHQR